MNNIFYTFLASIEPDYCFGCDEKGTVLCQECEGLFFPRQIFIPEVDIPCVSMGSYGNVISKIIKRWKVYRNDILAKPLARIALQGMDELKKVFVQDKMDNHDGYTSCNDLTDQFYVGIVSIVSDPLIVFSRIRKQQYVSSLHRLIDEMIICAKGTDIILECYDILDVNRFRTDQTGLSAEKRYQNMHNVFVVQKKFIRQLKRQAKFPKMFVLFDDIVSSGATLQDAYRAVSLSGITVSGCLVLANAEKRILE